MAYSYCWRYACLPEVFATKHFTAKVQDLERWNIARMVSQRRLITHGVAVS
jgi:hypothetical protein